MNTPAKNDQTDSVTLIHAGHILTQDPDNRTLANHSLVIHQGRILDILPTDQLPERYAHAEQVDRRHMILMPGLINAHTHLAMNLIRGFADDLPLMSWLQDHVWPTEAASVNDDFVREGTELALAECLLSGVTCVNDMYFLADVSAEVFERVGMRGTLGMVIFDFATAAGTGPDDYLDKGAALHDSLRDHPLLRMSLAPHAPYTVSRRPLERIASLSAELDVPVHMHVHETAAEVSDYVDAHGMRPLQCLDEIGLLGPSLLAVHMTQLTDAEIARLAETGTHALHCPESNLKLASGFCPVGKLVDAGVNVAIGTDGAASNNDLDLLGEMRTAALLAKAVAEDAAAVPAARALRMITIDAARALGRDDEIGSLEIGKAADVIAIEPDLTMAPIYDLASTLAYATGRERVRDVWVAGRQLVRDRQLLTLDADRIRQETERHRQAIIARRF